MKDTNGFARNCTIMHLGHCSTESTEGNISNVVLKNGLGNPLLSPSLFYFSARTEQRHIQLHGGCKWSHLRHLSQQFTPIPPVTSYKDTEVRQKFKPVFYWQGWKVAILRYRVFNVTSGAMERIGWCLTCGWGGFKQQTLSCLRPHMLMYC